MTPPMSKRSDSGSGRKEPEIRIGISGWTYAPWRGEFYPDDLPQRRELEFASRQVNSIEVNGTFYALHKPASYRRWRDETPDDFVFAVKANRYITHVRRLDDVKTPVANFIASGPLALGPKLGPILWQFPPSFRYERARTEAFLALLPHDTDEARHLARKHDAAITGRAALTSDHQGPLRHAMEIRHASFETGEFIDLLRDYDVALVAADTAGRWPMLGDLTSGFVYVRLHGDSELYRSGYGPDALKTWEHRIRVWAKGGADSGLRTVGKAPPPRKNGRDIYVYFDNTEKLHAPRDAMRMMERLGLPGPAAIS